MIAIISTNLQQQQARFHISQSNQVPNCFVKPSMFSEISSRCLQFFGLLPCLRSVLGCRTSLFHQLLHDRLDHDSMRREGFSGF